MFLALAVLGLVARTSESHARSGWQHHHARTLAAIDWRGTSCSPGADSDGSWRGSTCARTTGGAAI
jgi:hypothetical protein